MICPHFLVSHGVGATPRRASEDQRGPDKAHDLWIGSSLKITKLQSYNTRGLCNFVGFDDPEHSLYAISFVLKEPTQSTSACTSPSIVNSRASQVMGSPSSRAVCEVIGPILASSVLLATCSSSATPVVCSQ